MKKFKPVTEFQTVVAKSGKKDIYVGAYADPKAAGRVKLLFSQKENEDGNQQKL